MKEVKEVEEVKESERGVAQRTGKLGRREKGIECGEIGKGR
jgi:hypothetical protein